MSAQTHKGIVIPADQVAPCRLVELPNDHHAERAALEALVGGPVERVRYDVDAQLYVHQEGALLPLPSTLGPPPTRCATPRRQVASPRASARRPGPMTCTATWCWSAHQPPSRISRTRMSRRFHATFLT